MTKHPSRNWRTRMSIAANQWITRWAWKNEPGARLLTENELRDIMRKAYIAGYADGRKREPTTKEQGK